MEKTDITDIIGKKFGCYSVESYSHYHNKNHYYNVICDCGKEIKTQRGALMRHTSIKCNGHYKGVWSNKGGITTHLSYRSYYHMVSRCYDPKHIKYHLYGGRADGQIVKVDPRWCPNGVPCKEGFENFCEDMGPKPEKGWTIERRNPVGHYTPFNCYWLPVELQAKNRRANSKYKFVADLSEYLHLTWKGE